jgi:uncharacterized protein YjbI with pentapeptide repeats
LVECSTEGCRGAQVHAGACLAHLSGSDLDAYLMEVTRTGHVDARGVTLSADRLAEALNALPTDDDGRRLLRGGSFDNAHFTGDTVFDELRISGDARFQGATFSGDASFTRTTFTGDAGFDEATFTGDAGFDEATFTGNAGFSRARFSGAARFGGARFSGAARFGGATFASVSFELSRFEGPIHELGPLAAQDVTISRASFLTPVSLEVAADRIVAVRTTFAVQTTIRVRFAEMAFDGADFQAASVITSGMPAFADLDDAWLCQGRLDRRLESTEKARLVSLRGANAANLTLANLDLEACRFDGAHNLDRLTIEENCRLASAPPRFRFARRDAIAEEHDWRAQRGGPSARPLANAQSQPGSDAKWGWGNAHVRPPAWLAEKVGPVRRLESREIATIYRALRKRREDAKDAPGAADLYYGEMEMRRHTSAPPKVDGAGRVRHLGERLVLFGYWVTAGYGTRPSRALAALVATVLVFGIIFWQWGFRHGHGQSFHHAILFSAQSTTSLFRQPAGQPLTYLGGWIEMLLRLVGPLFFGLTLLALRGRVKR